MFRSVLLSKVELLLQYGSVLAEHHVSSKSWFCVYPIQAVQKLQLVLVIPLFPLLTLFRHGISFRLKLGLLLIVRNSRNISHRGKSNRLLGNNHGKRFPSMLCSYGYSIFILLLIYFIK